MPINAVYSEEPIPDWIKKIFVWHKYNQITDEEFVDGIKYLIDNEIVFVSESVQNMINLLINENVSILADNIFLHGSLPSSSNNITNFAVVADVGIETESFATLKNIEAVDPELILFAGDLSYIGPAKWFRISDFLGLDRMYVALGNHELDEKTTYMEHYGMKKEFYSFDYENVHFIALSMYTDYSEESEQFKFLENDLKSASTDPSIDWVIIFFHEPMYSDGIREVLIDFRNSLQSLFGLYSVDLVLQGHNHVYERSKPLIFNNTITDDSTFSYIEPQGQIYVTVGTGGFSHHKFYGKSEWSVIQNDEDFGFLNLIWSDNGRKMSGEFISNEGRILDNFVICLPSIRMDCPDTLGLNLPDTNLSRIVGIGKDLSYANLSGANLSGMDFTEVKLGGADLSGSDLTDTNLMLADLTNANLTGAIVGGDLLWGTYDFTSIPDVGIIELKGTLLFETNLSNADLSGINLSGMQMTFTNFSGVDLSGKDLTDTNLMLADLTNVTLNGADLTGADLRLTKFIGTNLQNAVGGPFIGCTGHSLCTEN